MRESREITMMPSDKERSDPDAFGALEDVGHRGVDEHDGDDTEADGAFALFPAPGGKRHGNRGGGHQHQDAGGVGAALGVDVGVEQPGDQEPDEREHQHQRTHGPCPPGRHAVPGQVPGNEVEQPGHRGSAGEPENGDGAQVIDGAEAVPEVFVGQESQGAAVGRAAGLEVLRRDQDHRGEAGRNEEGAHDDGGGCQQPPGTLDPAYRLLFGVTRASLNLRHHGHAGLEAGQAKGQLGEDQQGDPDHHERAPVLGGQGNPPVAHGYRVERTLQRWS